MFAQLPEEVQQRVTQYLEEDNFIAAKSVYDNWHKGQNGCNDTNNRKLHSLLKLQKNPKRELMNG